MASGLPQSRSGEWPVSHVLGPGRAWYCGIGSMMNTTALQLRGIYPEQSVWCEILDHRRVFYAPGGMATLCPDAGAIAHAIAHDISVEELATLEDLEPPSETVSVRLRSGSMRGTIVSVSVSVQRIYFLAGVSSVEVDAFVVQEDGEAAGRVVEQTGTGISVVQYRGNDTGFEVGKQIMVDGVSIGAPTAVTAAAPVPFAPTARYMDLIVEGAREAGMDPGAIAELAATPCRPRTPPEERKRLPCRDDASRRFSVTELSENLVVFRGKVFERPAGRQPLTSMFHTPGKDVAIRLSTYFYDPAYGLPPADPLEPWVGWEFIEDMAAQFYGDYTHVGWVESAGLRAKL
eukprot:gnl/TRDRNA2_/TRDRNA2_195948_c0_seq1.p1 gnl/TRDRNA2_/TRDRNA2_195948_c0~~gnl/TRDRNA2_/TRDRNA2_195948_c0_seq1.p1  ORF type:complete len:346 (+),score=42.52 gnl/TRDRNA2_/TRDRNA2_195948_c0_seq1:36-1073(+)